jgi:dipeptidyl aminopeptidase/acylaminoacyl peptidase
MFFPTAHAHRLIVSASFAFLVVLSTASGQIANVSELAFVRDSQIFRVRSDGTGLVQLTSDGMNSEPAWAPDGARIAFVRQGAATPEGWVTSDIYVMNADGSNVVRRTYDGRLNSSPAWSPDGTRIAFSRGGRIYVMRVDEDWWNPAPLGFDTGYNAHPAWSPDGSRIAFVSDWRGYDFVSELFVMNADGSDVRLLLSSANLVFYWQPAWSPDGGTIALTICGWAPFAVCFPDSSVALVNADGSGLRSIARTGGVARPSWSPDGMRIAFGSSACPECPSAIYYVTRDGTESGVLISDAHSPASRPSTTGFDTLVASHSQKCLDVNGGSLNDGASIIQWQCHGGANQQWRLEVAGDGYSRIVSRASGKCLDVNGGSPDDGASIIQWQCHGGANQQWRLEVAGDGYSRIVSRHSGKCLDVSGGSLDNGAFIIQWQCHGGANQNWRLLRLRGSGFFGPRGK